VTYSDWKDIAAAVQSLVTSIALIVGGAWAYGKFRYRRERDPRAEFDLDVTFAGTQDGRRLIEVNAYVENKGTVRHPIRDFSITIRHLLESDPIVDGSEAIRFQINVPHAVKRTLWKKTYIDPGLKYRNSYITSVPAEATFLLVFGRFYYNDDEFRMQRLFKISR
jgi:hypothetical protein